MGGTQPITETEVLPETDTTIAERAGESQGDDVIAPLPEQPPDAPGTDENGDGLKAEAVPDPPGPGDILNL